ncbi:alpha/beta fold hydrolase [Faecalicatena contorta]|uniref:alpha/beta fold hydrolase n=1 Tax=Faecalicatena contorta TaxID=39482 RepID=UPI001960DF44|nr:alpha/beta hydrolase [Faecalicatena contorta]
MKLEKVNLLGISGGAWVAVNTALKRPDLIDKVVADSFDGRTLHGGFAENLMKERIPLFCRPLEDLRTPVLFVGSAEDDRRTSCFGVGNVFRFR